MKRQYYVYIVTNGWDRLLYTGVTNDLERRVNEHKNKITEGFTNKYNAGKLVFYEIGEDVTGAIAREKQIKGWLRKKKVAIIESMNPEWRDLSQDWLGGDSDKTKSGLSF